MREGMLWLKDVSLTILILGVWGIPPVKNGYCEIESGELYALIIQYYLGRVVVAMYDESVAIIDIFWNVSTICISVVSHGPLDRKNVPIQKKKYCVVHTRLASVLSVVN